MNDGYLWDRSGESDPEVVHLEKLLGDLKWPEQALQGTRPMQRRHNRVWMTMAAAAAVALCLGTALYVQRMHRMHATTSWQLSLAGQKPSAVRTGQVIETFERTSATMESQSVGEVEIDANSRVRMMASQHAP